MGVGPRAKRARKLAIAKLPTGNIVAMFKPPGDFQRAERLPQSDASAGLDSALALDDLDFLPGGCQPLEGPGPFVPTKDLVGRCRNPRALSEDVGHLESPATRWKPDPAAFGLVPAEGVFGPQDASAGSSRTLGQDIFNSRSQISSPPRLCMPSHCGGSRPAPRGGPIERHLGLRSRSFPAILMVYLGRRSGRLLGCAFCWQAGPLAGAAVGCWVCEEQR
jgi:hypothetical protein